MTIIGFLFNFGLLAMGAGCESPGLTPKADIAPSLLQDALAVDIEFNYDRFNIKHEFTGPLTPGRTRWTA